jgi:hypothetical protein
LLPPDDDALLSDRARERPAASPLAALLLLDDDDDDDDDPPPLVEQQSARAAFITASFTQTFIGLFLLREFLSPFYFGWGTLGSFARRSFPLRECVFYSMLF